MSSLCDFYFLCYVRTFFNTPSIYVPLMRQREVHGNIYLPNGRREEKSIDEFISRSEALQEQSFNISRKNNKLLKQPMFNGKSHRMQCNLSYYELENYFSGQRIAPSPTYNTHKQSHKFSYTSCDVCYFVK
jgi:hypothetical protein